MKRLKLNLLLFLVSFLYLTQSQGICGKKEIERIENCINVVTEILQGEEGKAARYLLAHSKGIVIFPGIKKAAFIIGAKRGKGVIVLRKNGRWLPPYFVTIYGGSFGFQAGAKSSDVVLIIMTNKAVNSFKSNKLKLGIDLAITAGEIGKETGISSEDLYKTDIYFYAKEKGVFVGINLAGSVITHDEDSNLRFYKKEVTIEDILNGKLNNKEIPKEAKELIKVLKKFSRI